MIYPSIFVIKPKAESASARDRENAKKSRSHEGERPQAMQLKPILSPSNRTYLEIDRAWCLLINLNIKVKTANVLESQ